MSHAQDSPAPPGYLSEQDKRRFTTVAGVLGAVFFFVQVLVPMAAMLFLMPFWMLSTEMHRFDLDGAAILDGTIYVVDSTLPGFQRGPAKSRLLRFDPDGPHVVAELEGWMPGLLAHDRRLWLISSNRIGFLTDGRIEYVPGVEPLGDIGPPFLFQGVPAVAERHPDGDRAQRWGETGWVEVAVLPARDDGCNCDVLVADGPDLLSLTRSGQTLFSQVVTVASDETTGWVHVAANASSWSSFIWDGHPAVAIMSPSGALRLLQYEKNKWRPREGPELEGLLFDLAVLQDQPGAPLRLLTQTFPGSLRERVWDGRSIVEDRRLQRNSPFPWQMSFGMVAAQGAPVLLSLLLAVVLSSMMRTHRVGIHLFAGRRVPYASLTRRALAQVVDSALAFMPLGVVGLLWIGPGMEGFFEEGPASMLWLFAWMAGALLCALLVLVGLSFTEGVWGGSPGKWLVGIRVVGTNLEPCGFGRALIRNLLKLVDGFFNFLVGILMVAFTAEWQRLGDLAARTIVIRHSPPPGPHSPSPPVSSQAGP